MTTMDEALDGAATLLEEAPDAIAAIVTERAQLSADAVGVAADVAAATADEAVKVARRFGLKKVLILLGLAVLVGFAVSYSKKKSAESSYES